MRIANKRLTVTNNCTRQERCRIMAVTDWLSQTARRVRQDGVSGATRSAHEFYVGAFRRLGRVYNYGTPIYDRDWDLLVVLDACRADLMDEVADRYDFIDHGNSTTSVGSATEEWMMKTFTPEYHDEMRKTAYVTGNPHSSEGLSAEQFEVLDEVWKYAWDDDQKTIPARPITDRAISTARETNPDRLLVHYMQPHHPFVPSPELSEDVGFEDETTWNHIWERLRAGDVTEERIWEAYRKNLEYVLDDVELLLNNVDAETAIITSDHGNALGEFGIYGHPLYVPVPELKRIPWSVTTATDNGEYRPKLERPTEDKDIESEVNERLHDLGYKE